MTRPSNIEIMEQQMEEAILGQLINSEEADPAIQVNIKDIAANGLIEAKIEIDGQEIEDPELVEELVAAAGDAIDIEPEFIDPEAEIAEEDVIVEGGMSVAELRALQIASAEKAADYDRGVQTENAAQFVNEAKLDGEVAAGIYSPDDPDSHFAQAENHERNADSHNKAAHRNEVQRDGMEALEARVSKALESVPGTPKPPMGA